MQGVDFITRRAEVHVRTTARNALRLMMGIEIQQCECRCRPFWLERPGCRPLFYGKVGKGRGCPHMSILLMAIGSSRCSISTDHAQGCFWLHRCRGILRRVWIFTIQSFCNYYFCIFLRTKRFEEWVCILVWYQRIIAPYPFFPSMVR